MIPADALCMECGLCCDGTLFGSVRVEPEERNNLERVGLRIVDGDGALMLTQRCTALHDCLCDVYADRPAACAQYECLLRKSLLAGAKTVDQGRAEVARMRTLLATLARSFDVPASSTVSVWEALLSLEEPATFEEGTEASAKQDAGIDALTELLALGRAAFEPAFSGGS